MRTATVSKAASVRFDPTESPATINEGNGWTEDKARAWLDRHNVVASVKADGDFLRAKVREGGKVVDMREVATGVMVILCENSD